MKKNNQSNFNFLIKKYKYIKKAWRKAEDIANRQAEKAFKKYYIGKCFKRSYRDGSYSLLKITDLEVQMFAETILFYGPITTVRSDGTIVSNEKGTTAIVITFDLTSNNNKEISEKEYNDLVSKLLNNK